MNFDCLKLKILRDAILVGQERLTVSIKKSTFSLKHPHIARTIKKYLIYINMKLVSCT